MQAGNHTSLQYSIVAAKCIPVLTQCSIVTVHSVPPALARPPAKASPRTSRRAFLSILVAAYTLDMASRILPERTVPMPSGQQIVSPANDREVGPRRALLDGAEPWVLQLQRPPPMAETGSCSWGRGQRDASECDAAAGCRNPLLFAEKAPSTQPMVSGNFIRCYCRSVI